MCLQEVKQIHLTQIANHFDTLGLCCIIYCKYCPLIESENEFCCITTHLLLNPKRHNILAKLDRIACDNIWQLYIALIILMADFNDKQFSTQAIQIYIQYTKCR